MSRLNWRPIFLVSRGIASAAPSVGAVMISDGSFAVFFVRLVTSDTWNDS